MPLEFPPETHALLGWRRLPLSWKTALAEVIDNSLDAGARKIEIVGKPGYLRVKDDGQGAADLVPFFGLGRHLKLKSTRSGIYGNGGTGVMVWMWGKTEVASTHDGITRVARVTWDQIYASERFSTDDVAEPMKTGAASGTQITYWPTGKDVRQIADAAVLSDLAWTFRPALEAGVRLVVLYSTARKPGKPEVLQAPSFPRLVKATTVDGEINDKAFTLNMGIIDQGESLSRSGFHLARGLRVIETTHEPANGYDGSRFFAWVDLSEDWAPSMNKTELVDADRNLLFARLTEICQPLLAEATLWAEEVENDEVETEISSRLSAVMVEDPTAKAKRESPANPTGAIEPKESGQTHRKAQRVQPGEKPLSTPGAKNYGRSGVKFRLGPLDPHEFCKVTRQGQALTVTFNDQCSFVVDLRKESGLHALTGMAFAAVAAWASTHEDDQIVFRFKQGDSYSTLQKLWLAWAQSAGSA